MTGRTGDFNKQIRNARNSNDKFEVEVDTGANANDRPKRVSASFLKSSIIHGPGTKKNFTTITPQGLPPDLIGNEDNLVERQNVLIEPKGYRYEAARLPPFKPFKTISDEDNIHLLPGETGERARLNLLDTKAVTKKDVEETRKAYEKQRKQYPELYRKTQAALEDEGDTPQQQKKKGFFGKLFGKKLKEQKLPPQPQPLTPPAPTPETPPPPPQDQELPPPPPEEEKQKPPSQEPPAPRKSIIKPMRKSVLPPPPKKLAPSARRPTLVSRRKSVRPPTPSESEEEETSTSESSSEEEQQWGYGPPGPGGMMPYYGGGGYPQPPPYPGAGGYPQPSPYPGPGAYPQYPGMPGGYSPYFNQGYASGYGPTQMPLPPYNQCMEDIRLECCKKMLKNKQMKNNKGQGDESGTVSSWQTSKMKPKKAQGLNFDFLPHDDLATEVTMVIEPDEPEPLQFAVENGIMPIICCYMPSSVAVQQAPDYQASSLQAYSNNSNSSPSTNSYGSSSSPSYGYGYSAQTSYATGSTQFTKDTTNEEFSLPPLDDEDESFEEESIGSDHI